MPDDPSLDRPAAIANQARPTKSHKKPPVATVPQRQRGRQRAGLEKINQINDLATDSEVP
jgi:hypothetical protein